MEPITEAEISAHSKYPRVTPDQLDAQIKSVAFDYHDLTVKCTITMQNGFSVHGHSGCAVPGNYKRETGERLALTDAKNKMWQLLGYELKTKVALVIETLFPDMLGVKDEGFIEPLVTYVGTKVIRATPMTLGHYNHHRNWEIPLNENPDRLGYIIQYPDGYISWSPKEIFESAYEEMNVRGEGAIGGPTWCDRLEIEKNDLLEKLDKLTTFIASPKFDDVAQEQKDLLMGQMSAMSSYFAILKLQLGEG